MQQGWVYVLVNSSMPGMAKVGRTARLPSERVAELSGATGVATPFVLAFDQHFADCHAAEKAVHEELDRRGLRVAPNREFFRGPPSDIIRVVLDTAQYPAGPSSVSADDRAAWLLAAGDSSLCGVGERLGDTAEAIRLYKLAMTRGSLVAYERLGRIYMARNGVAARRRALEILGEGVRRGNHYCYPEMAAVFAWESNVASFNKAWTLFFAAEDARLHPGGEVAADRYEKACCRYIAASLALGLQPAYRDRLKDIVHPLVRLLLSELDQVRQDRPARRQVAACLRWVHQSLLPSQPAQARSGLARRQAGLPPTESVPFAESGQVACCSGA